MDTGRILQSCSRYLFWKKLFQICISGFSGKHWSLHEEGWGFFNSISHFCQQKRQQIGQKEQLSWLTKAAFGIWLQSSVAQPTLMDILQNPYQKKKKKNKNSQCYV